MIDDMTALRLQLDWGIDDGLGELPVDRFAVLAPARVPVLAEAPRPRPVAAGGSVAAVPPWQEMETLDALFDALDGFSACSLRATATHTVRPSGAASAPVVFVAEAPDGDDDRSGRAFSGAAGAVLDRVLASLGWGRDHMLFTTLVPWRPPGNRPPSESEIQACLPAVRRLLSLVRPRAVVLAGACPVAALTGRSGTIRQLRGRWVELPLTEAQTKLDALPILPLAQWLRDGGTKQQLWSDLLLLRTALASV